MLLVNHDCFTGPITGLKVTDGTAKSSRVVAMLMESVLLATKNDHAKPSGVYYLQEY